MDEEILKRIADSLERIAVCMENSQAREIAKNKKELAESLKKSMPRKSAAKLG